MSVTKNIEMIANLNWWD